MDKITTTAFNIEKNKVNNIKRIKETMDNIESNIENNTKEIKEEIKETIYNENL